MFFNADGQEVAQEKRAPSDSNVDRRKQLREQALNKRKNKMGSSNMLRAQTDAPSWSASGRQLLGSKPTASVSAGSAPGPPKKTDGDSRPSTARDYDDRDRNSGDRRRDDRRDDRGDDRRDDQRGGDPDKLMMTDINDDDLDNDQPARRPESKGYDDRDDRHNKQQGGFTDTRGGRGRDDRDSRDSRRRDDRDERSGGSGGGGYTGYSVETNLDLSNMERFLTNPVPRRSQHKVIQAYIKRVKNGLRNKMYPVYEMYLTEDDKFLLTAKKRSKNKTSNYMISQDRNAKKEGAGFLGKVRANFVGTEFVIFDEGVNPTKLRSDQKSEAEDTIRRELGCVLYEQNILGSKGPRKMTVVLPSVEDNQTSKDWRPTNDREGILAAYKANKHDGLTSMCNKEPKWNDKVNAYVLNFNGRVAMASVKNFQLATKEDEDRCVLQFGRMDKDKFNVDFAWPLSPLQAFAICLSSFDYKFACE